VNLQLTVVIKETQLPEFVHLEARERVVPTISESLAKNSGVATVVGYFENK
jgi:hypothetical protein